MRLLYYFSAALLLFTFTVSPARAFSLIRDAEIEHTLRIYSNPILRTAGLQPDNVHIFIVNSDQINAFVAGGANIFLHTGLILASDSPEMLQGVIAHETGHIAGGHLARGAEKFRNAQIGIILSYVLGAAAAVAGGGEAGAAIMSGGSSILQRTLLAYSRTQEQAADQAALGYLSKLGISSQGMLDLFELLRRQELRRYGQLDPYAITHPLSKERIESVRAHLQTTNSHSMDEALIEKHARMRAKLFAFLELPPKTFARYPERDKSVAAYLARAVAWMKLPNLEKALNQLDTLQQLKPNDPFIYDLRGQILFENGRIADAREAYAKAIQLRPKDALLLTDFSAVALQTGSEKDIQLAIQKLEYATQLDATNPRAWRLLGTAYGKQRNEGMSRLALAEEGLLIGEPEHALHQVELALTHLPVGAPARLRAEDIKRAAKQMQREKDTE